MPQGRLQLPCHVAQALIWIHKVNFTQDCSCSEHECKMFCSSMSSIHTNSQVPTCTSMSVTCSKCVCVCLSPHLVKWKAEVGRVSLRPLSSLRVELRQKERKQRAGAQRADCNLVFWLLINCVVLLGGGKRYPVALTDSRSRHSTEYKSINLNNKSEHNGISIFPWQEALCIFTQGQQCVSVLFGLHKAI